ncbi:MAG TPA: prepilin-type N-terminal cleavage/methylation domain-containing protein [Lacipirellulaceae bacterium]|nr:prepilin-type N-terminal cleavage/methylation domain-containing protein [Lacipirellulaceae bacterium]HMP06397.1 prepilin-type N-terminal cleavage/methylation domain-containing protein [Lacipirellulaceae bacterium]
MDTSRNNRRAYTLTELMGVAAILSVVAAIVMVRATSGSSASKSAACQTLKGDIEIQCEIWRHNNGSWPASDLANIGASLPYFPQGVPACPVDGSGYSINGTGRVIGHNH